MEAQALCNLISYGMELNVINNTEPMLEEINNLIENKEMLKINMTSGTSYYYDFNDINSKDSVRFINRIRKIIPVVGVIDLVIEAISLGVVTDISNDYGVNDLLSFESDYSDISKEKVFYFKINSEMFDDTIYKITFNKKYHDIKNKIEYASRTSQFIDTLIKRIMAKYNILLVRKASWIEEGIPELPLDESSKYEFSGTIDSSLETDMIENQLKVLVNYRDNFNNTTCNENVIDDIFVNISGNEIKYGFINIGQSDEADPVYDVINNDVKADDIDSLLRIRNLISDSDVKFNIFEALRNNKDTNLSNLIEQRISEYDEKLNTDPKIEFTITPLSIYCNHIVKKTANYTIYSINPNYSNFDVDYSIQYNPANIKYAEYNIYADGEIEPLHHDDILVLAFDDICGNELHPKVTSKKYATMLYGLDKRYDNDKYKDVYFLNEKLVKIINNELYPYDGNPDSNTYLRSQVVRGEITGHYLYIDDAIEIGDDDILGVDLLDIDTKRYIGKEFKRVCDMCGHIYGASDEVWELYKNSHKLINDNNGRCCCDNCKGSIIDNKAIIYSSGYKEYYLDDPKDSKYTDLCISCENIYDSFVYINPNNKLRGLCKICNRYYCSKHIENNICNNCRNSSVSKNNISDKLLKKIRTHLDPKDILSKELEFNYKKDNNCLWVYSSNSKVTKSYYFIVDEEEKFVHLYGKYVKRGGK